MSGVGLGHCFSLGLGSFYIALVFGPLLRPSNSSLITGEQQSVVLVRSLAL